MLIANANPIKDPPRFWLIDVDPGGGFLKAKGLGFFSEKLVPFLIQFALFLVVVLSLIFLIVGGIMYSTSGGNKEGMAKARATITYALVGLVLGLSSYLILFLLGSLFGFRF